MTFWIGIFLVLIASQLLCAQLIWHYSIRPLLEVVNKLQEELTAFKENFVELPAPEEEAYYGDGEPAPDSIFAIRKQFAVDDFEESDYAVWDQVEEIKRNAQRANLGA